MIDFDFIKVNNTITIYYDGQPILTVIDENTRGIDLDRKNITNMALIQGLELLPNLITLSLNDNKITRIENLDTLTSLQLLSMIGNDITSIENLQTLEYLESLFLSNNRISRIQGLDALTRLNFLYLDGNEITTIEGLNSLERLTWLKLKNNKIERIEGLDNLVNLHGLRLEANNIGTIENLNALINLNVLELSYNRIAKIQGLENLRSLSSLNLDNNKITMIEGLENLHKLSSLDLHNNLITVIEGLHSLENLDWLILSCNRITKIQGLNSLHNLRKLKIDHNHITEIVESQNVSEFNSLDNLEWLDLSDNRITVIQGLNASLALKELDLSNNRITKIESLDSLENLERLILSNNQITEIEGLETLVNLESLNLSSNQITEIEGLETLVNLASLNFYNNEISDVKGLGHLNNLKWIDLGKNLLPIDQEDLISGTAWEIRKYCQMDHEPIGSWPPSEEEFNSFMLLDVIMDFGTPREKKSFVKRQNNQFINTEVELVIGHNFTCQPLEDRSSSCDYNGKSNSELQVYLVQLHILDPISPFAHQASKTSRFLNFVSQFWDSRKLPALVYDNIMTQFLIKRIERIIDTILQDDGDTKLIVFPENSIPSIMIANLESKVKFFINSSGDHDRRLVIIGGLEHELILNRAFPIDENETCFIYKNRAFILDGGSPQFQEKQTQVKIDFHTEMMQEPIVTQIEPKIKIFLTAIGKIAIFICKDFLRLTGAIQFWARKNGVNYIVIPSLTSKVLPFTQRIISLYEQPNMENITIITANVGEYGGSEVYCLNRKDDIERSFHDNHRDNVGEVVVKRIIKLGKA